MGIRDSGWGVVFMSTGTLLTVASPDWRKFTDSRDQLRVGPLMDGLDEAPSRNFDVFFAAEVGSTSCTMETSADHFDGDWECGKGSVVCVCVGAFVKRRWAGKWCALSGGCELRNARVCLGLVDTGRQRLI